MTEHKFGCTQEVLETNRNQKSSNEGGPKISRNFGVALLEHQKLEDEIEQLHDNLKYIKTDTRLFSFEVMTQF